MANAALIEFVREALLRGENRDAIRQALEKAGWASDQVRDAINAFDDGDFPVPVPRPRRSGSAREAFLYIVYFILLGVIAGYAGALAFAWIDAVFTDAIFDRSWRSGVRFMRWGVAWLLVGAPIFFFLGWRLGSERRRDPERRASRVRVWLTYIALIFAATTFIGDIVFVVFRFLGGDLGSRFLAKALVVAAISGAVIINYTRDAERSSTQRDRVGWSIAVVAGLVVTFLVVWAFTVINSPIAARALAADERRVSDLGVVARLVDCHRTYEGETPENLASAIAARDRRIADGALIAPRCDADLPADPSGDDYQYIRLDTDRYRLCARFAGGWSDQALGSENRRRRIARGFAGDEEAPYILLPTGPGEACFDFRARDVSRSGNAGGERLQ
ncbi:MAG: DUF5671 domain-containing protein [Pseudomonadota bacterium]